MLYNNEIHYTVNMITGVIRILLCTTNTVIGTHAPYHARHISRSNVQPQLIYANHVVLTLHPYHRWSEYE